VKNDLGGIDLTDFDKDGDMIVDNA